MNVKPVALHIMIRCRIVNCLF